MSRRNSHENKQVRRNLRAVRPHPEPAEFRYLYEVGDEENTPGTYYPADVHTIAVSRCTAEGCDCGDILIGAATNNHRQLVIDVVFKDEHVCPDCMAKRLKMHAHRHGIPTCVHGSGDRDDPVIGWCSRSIDHHHAAS